MQLLKVIQELQFISTASRKYFNFSAPIWRARHLNRINLISLTHKSNRYAICFLSVWFCSFERLNWIWLNDIHMFCTHRRTVRFVFWLGMIIWASRCSMDMIVYILYYGKTNVLDLKWNHIVWIFFSQNNIYIWIMSIFRTVGSFFCICIARSV